MFSNNSFDFSLLKYICSIALWRMLIWKSASCRWSESFWRHFVVTESWNEHLSGGGAVLIFSRASFHLQPDVVRDAEKAVVAIVTTSVAGSRVAAHDEMDRLLRSATWRR